MSHLFNDAPLTVFQQLHCNGYIPKYPNRIVKDVSGRVIYNIETKLRLGK